MSAHTTLDETLRAPCGSRADEQMTANRVETKYLVPRERTTALVAELTRRLPSHRFTGEGANRLPDAHHFVTTVYFDTESHAHYRAAVSNVEQNVKVRAKEYYDLHPSLAELATDPRQIVRYQPWVWFELKRREGARTSKRRFRLPKRDVPAFFSRGQLIADGMGAPGGAEASSRAELDEVVEYCRSLSAPLVPSCLVNYRRLSFQDRGALRVTIDLGLAFYSVPSDLWSREHAFVRSTLGQPRGTVQDAVLEIKRRAPAPPWLDELLTGVGVRPIAYSKFVAATEAVFGESRAR